MRAIQSSYPVASPSRAARTSLSGFSASPSIDNDELSISGLESVSSTSTLGTNSLRTSGTAAGMLSVTPIGDGTQSQAAAQPWPTAKVGA